MKRFVWLTLLVCCPSVVLAEPTKPNVLLVITDDQGYGDFSIHGNPHLQTPNIDKLGAEGVRFDRFYVNSFCAPTRAALLTGRWPLRTGCFGVTHNAEAIRPSETTLAESLGQAGYRTACIGKWHNGEQFPYTPRGQGFHESLGFNNGHVNNYFDATLLRGAKAEPTQGYISDVLTDEAIKFVSANKESPFFCYLAFNAPHSPYQVPDRYYDKFKAKGFDESVSAFYGMCENIDDNVGRLLAHLEHEKLTSNTLVLFLTDNGGTAGVKLYNAGMRGGKTSVHEGGTRVPLFVRWPAAQWSPHVVSTIASHIDILPTVLDLCDVPLPTHNKIDGTSLRPLLESSDESSWRERTLFTHNPINESNRYPGAVRTQRYRLVKEIKGAAGGSRAKANDQTALAWQLYDMKLDPSQEHDIASKHPDLVDELAARYEAWYDDVASEGRGRFPLPIGHAEHNPVKLFAPQAYYDKPLTFASGPGFAHDWLTGWSDPKAKVWFEIDVVQEGEYELVLAVACPNDSAGTKLRLHVGDEALETTIPSAPPVEIPLPHRDEAGHAKYRDREWSAIKVGSLSIPKGKTRIILEPLSMPGSQGIDFKHLELFRRSGS